MNDQKEWADEMLKCMKIIWKSKFRHHILAQQMRGERVILNYLLYAKGDVLPSDISQEMETSTARTAAVLNNLENKGLIMRQINKKDRRQILVSLTKKGEESAKEHEREHFEKLQALFEFLGKDDAMEFVRIIQRIADAKKT